MLDALAPVDASRFCEGAEAQEPPFGDIAGHTFEAEIRCLAAAGVTRGVTDDVYAPDIDVTRGQMASFIANLLDTAAEMGTGDPAVRPLPAHDGTNRFTDVRPSDVHLADINRLAAAGIALGGPGGAPAERYGPELSISRDQMASFVARALAYATGEAMASDGDHFTDDDANVHETAIDAVAEHGIAVGVEDGRFDPGTAIDRGQMAGFLTRSLALLEHRSFMTPLPS